MRFQACRSSRTPLGALRVRTTGSPALSTPYQSANEGTLPPLAARQQAPSATILPTIPEMSSLFSFFSFPLGDCPPACWGLSPYHSGTVPLPFGVCPPAVRGLSPYRSETVPLSFGACPPAARGLSPCPLGSVPMPLGDCPPMPIGVCPHAHSHYTISPPCTEWGTFGIMRFTTKGTFQEEIA